jgi:hypothetical protein
MPKDCERRTQREAMDLDALSPAYGAEICWMNPKSMHTCSFLHSMLLWVPKAKKRKVKAKAVKLSQSIFNLSPKHEDVRQLWK